MNTVKYFLAIFSCFALTIWAGLYLGNIKQGLGVENIIKFIALLAAAIAMFSLAERYRKLVEWLPQEPDRRPHVKVWTHNGTTRVVPELDWRLWWELYGRNMFVGIEGRGLRPNPDLIILFTDLRTNFKTGDMKDCEALLDSCRVEKSGMFVPRYDPEAVNLETAWKLINGPNAKPPARD